MSKIPIGIPRRFFGRNQFAITTAWANSVSDSIQRLRDRKQDHVCGAKGGGGQRLPFEVEIFNSAEAGENPVWKIRVHPGRVNERIPGERYEATKTHKPGNLYDESDPPKLSEFTVQDGKAVYISVEVDADGKVIAAEEGDDPVNIEIGNADPGPDSIHYEPKVDDETSDGVAGTYKYKLAEIHASEDGPDLVLENFLAGSHISHFQELPAIKNTKEIAEGVGCISKKWDNDLKHYKLRSLWKGFGKLKIQTLADEVEVRGTKIDNEFVVFKGDTEDSLGRWEFSDGLLMTGEEVEGDEEPPVEITPLEICVPIVVSRESTFESPKQINVTETGAKSSTYVVEGNGVDTYFELTRDGTQVARLDFIDGLLSESVDTSVEIGAALPEGERGDVLVHDGDGWVALANPGAATSPNRNFFVHDGDMPTWLEMTATEIQICESGTPVTKTIYTEPPAP